MKHYMKMICPERGPLNPEASISWSGNVQIIPIRRKCGAGAEWVRVGGKSNCKMSAIR